MKFLGKVIALIIIVVVAVMLFNGKLYFSNSGNSSSSASQNDPLSEKPQIEALSKKIGVELAVPGEGILVNAPQRSGTIYVNSKGVILDGDPVRVPMTKDGLILQTDKNTGEIILDSLGNPVYSKTDVLKKDADGNAVIDKDGNVIVVRTVTATDSNSKTDAQIKEEARQEVLKEIAAERAPAPDILSEDTTSGVVFRISSVGGISESKDRIVVDSRNNTDNGDYVVTSDGSIVLRSTTTEDKLITSDDSSSTSSSDSTDSTSDDTSDSTTNDSTTTDGDSNTTTTTKVVTSDPLRVRNESAMSLLGVSPNIQATSIVPNITRKASNVNLSLLSAGEPVTSAMSTKTIIDNWSTSIYAGAVPAVFVDASGIRHSLSVYAPSYDNGVLTISFIASDPQYMPDKLIYASAAHDNKTVAGQMPETWSGGTFYLMLPSVRVYDACVILPYAVCDRLDLYQAPFSKAEMYNASFVGANLGEASLDRGIFNNSDFSDANMSRADIQQSNFENTKTTSKTIMVQMSASGSDMKNSVFRKVQMSRIDFNDANLSGSDFSGADAYSMLGKNADFSNIVATDAIMSRATAPGADFHNSDLRGVDFSYSDLRNVNFNGADLRGANFNGADLRGASFSKAKVLGVKCPSGVTVTSGTCNWNFTK